MLQSHNQAYQKLAVWCESADVGIWRFHFKHLNTNSGIKQRYLQWAESKAYELLTPRVIWTDLVQQTDCSK